MSPWNPVSSRCELWLLWLYLWLESGQWKNWRSQGTEDHLINTTLFQDTVKSETSSTVQEFKFKWLLHSEYISLLCISTTAALAANQNSLWIFFFFFFVEEYEVAFCHSSTAICWANYRLKSRWTRLYLQLLPVCGCNSDLVSLRAQNL